MAPLPKRRTARARRGERQSHLHRSRPNLSTCPQCQSPKLPHHACSVCGTYNGQQVVKLKGPKQKKE